MQEHLEHSRAKGTTFHVGIAIAYYANHESGLSFPSNDTLIARWHFKERTIEASLRELEQLGEIARRPDLESFERRRVYIVGHQTSLADMLDETPANGSAGANALAPAVHLQSARPCKEPKNLRTSTPPTPLPGGSSTSPSPSSTPSAVDRSPERAARRSRRTRSRRGRNSASDVCPLSLLDAERLAVLAQEASTIVEALESRYGEDTKHGRSWRLRSRGAHLHALDPLTLALPTVDLGWVKAEFPIALEKVCGRPVQLVACDCGVSL